MTTALIIIVTVCCSHYLKNRPLIDPNSDITYYLQPIHYLTNG